MASVTVDDTDPRIQYLPRGQWKANDICVACAISSRNMNELRKDAFNATWHAAPGAQLDFKTMAMNFNFSGSDPTVRFIFFRRTDERGRTRDDGRANLFLSLDGGDRRGLPLTLERWEDEELQQQYRIFDFRVPSEKPGNHTLNIQFTRDDAMDIPVTVALDSIRFKPLSSNSGSGDQPSTVPTQPDTGTTSTKDDTGTPPTQDPDTSPTETGTATPAGSPSGALQTQSRTINVAKIVAPVAAVIILLVLLIGILLCWRRRQIQKHRRLKASIRAFQPIPFDPYPQKIPYPFYQPHDVEKPAPIVPAYTQRGSRPTSLLDNGSVFEPLPRLSASGDSLFPTRHPLRNSADSTSQPSFISYEQQWRFAASQKRPVSTTSDGKSPTGPTPAYPHFVVVNR